MCNTCLCESLIPQNTTTSDSIHFPDSPGLSGTHYVAETDLKSTEICLLFLSLLGSGVIGMSPYTQLIFCFKRQSLTM